MKNTLLTLIVLLAAGSVSAQEYLSAVYKESGKDINAVTFRTTGKAKEKDNVEENAILSIFHNIIYIGVPGVNDGKPFVTPNTKENKVYTSSFFNSECRYKQFLGDKEIEVESRPKRANGVYQGTYLVEIKLENLLRSLEKNVEIEPKSTLKPSIMIVPLKLKKNESYKSLLANNRTLRTAVTKIQEAFGRFEDIETQNAAALDKLLDGLDKYDVPTSNERELLRRAEADVLVEFDLVVVEEKNGKKVSINLNAYETATLNYWASTVVSSKVRDINDIDALCADALKGHSIRGFIDEICKEFKKPTSALMDFTISYDADFTMYDICENGETVEDNIRVVLDNNAYKGEYREKGANRGAFYCDEVLIPRADDRNRKMTAGRFASIINKELRKMGIKCEHFTEGNKIIITLLSIE